MLSDKDIKAALEAGDIVITPFSDGSLTPVGYDLRVGEYAFSWDRKKVINIPELRDEKLVIGPGDSVIISTYEKIGLSPKIGGTVHSIVRLVTEGLSHVSTTLDPGWPGPRVAYPEGGHLLVRLHNTRKARLRLKHGERFCTVCLYRMDTPATEKEHGYANISRQPDEWIRRVKSRALELEKPPFWKHAWFWFFVGGAVMLAVTFMLRPQNAADWFTLLGVVAVFVVAGIGHLGKPPIGGA